jgi:fucose permease
MERTSLPLEKAGLAISLYFAARTIGTFAGAILLMKVSGRKFYIASMVLGLAAMVLMMVLSNLYAILVMIFCLGLAIANVFPIVFSAALRKEPTRANEVSGLLIMGVAGGAIVPPIMGIISDSTGQTGAMVVLLISLVYLLFNALKMQKD